MFIIREGALWKSPCISLRAPYDKWHWLYERNILALGRENGSLSPFWLIFYLLKQKAVAAFRAVGFHIGLQNAHGAPTSLLFVAGLSLVAVLFGFIPFGNQDGFFTGAKSTALAQSNTRGETMGSAYKNIQTYTILSAARNIDPNPARGGGGVTVVDDSALVSEDGPEGTGIDIISQKPSSDQIALYVVREGDTLSAIASMFKVSPNTLRWANNLSPKSAIQPGDSLIVLPMDGLRHTISAGDTLASIARTYDADPGEILIFNGLEEGSSLVKGSTITIPGGEMPAPKVQKPSTKRTQTNGVPLKSGSFVRPLLGGVRTQGIHGYNAIDFGASIGTEVRAAAAGKVILSRAGGWNGGYGNYIVVDHGNGTQTLYAHLSANSVGMGEYVAQGQTIGAVGSTGRSTGPHLHFEVRGAKNPF